MIKPSSKLSNYVNTLRKRWALLLFSMLLVGAGGAVYLDRQRPLYEASVELLMEKPVPNLLASRRGWDPFEVDTQTLNTELHLLRADTELAGQVVEKMKAQGVDAERLGYTAASLPGRLKVRPVGGTKLVRLSLTGGDPTALPMAVNLYAEEYQKLVETTRSATYERQRDVLQGKLDEVAGALDEAGQTRSDFAEQHKELNLAAGENPIAEELTAVARSLHGLEAERVSDGLTRDEIVKALDNLGIEARETERGYTLVSPSAEPLSLDQTLSGDAVIQGLPTITGNAEVRRLRGDEAAAEKLDQQLANEGRKPADADRQAAVGDIEKARRKQGQVIAQALAYELSSIAARAEYHVSLKTRYDELKARHDEINGYLTEFDALEQQEVAKKRAYDDATVALAQFDNQYLADVDSEGGAVESPRIRITMKRRAKHARQIAPNSPMQIGLTIAAALSVGLGLVFLFDFLDDTIKSKEDLNRYVRLPFLGSIPRISSKDATMTELAAAEAASGSAVAESFRAVRTSILFSRSDSPVKSLLITSAGPSEGKTTIAVNMAVSFAHYRAPVLVIDADLRKPRLAAALGIDSPKGLTNVLVGEATLDDVVQPTGVDGLYAVTSGPIPPNPSELLHGERMKALIREASEKYSHVVVDSPPLAAVTDARVLADCVDGLYLVVLAGKTTRRLLVNAVESLTSIDFPVHGVILNDRHGRHHRYGEYGYYYSRDKPS